MKELLKAAKDFRPSTEGHYLTDGKILLRLEPENADPAVVQSLFPGDYGRPTESACRGLLPETLTGSLAVPIVDTRVSLKESRPIRKGRKTTYEITEYGIFKATSWVLNDAGSVTDLSLSYSFFDLSLVKKAVSLVKAHYGPFNADSLLFFQEPESGKIIGTIRDTLPVFVLGPVSNMLERKKDRVCFSGLEITEILDGKMEKA